MRSTETGVAQPANVRASASSAAPPGKCRIARRPDAGVGEIRGPHASLRHEVRDGHRELTEFFVLPEVWRTEVLNGFEMTIINKALIDRGLLIPDKQGHACKSERISGFGTMRVYHLSPTIIGE